MGRMIKRKTKRSLALLLVLNMLISAMNMGAVIGVKAAQRAETVSFGSLLAVNVADLGDAEAEILCSGLLAGDTVTYQSPDNSDGLITVDPDTKEITVSPYTDGLGNTWKAVSCRVVSHDGQEIVSLTDGKGSFAYEGDAYTVEADYKLTVSVDNPEFTEKLLKAPYMLAKGVENLDVLCGSDVQATLEALAQNRDLLQRLVDGYDMYGPGGVLIKHLDFPCKDSAQKLVDQCDANDGKLDLKVKGDECKNSASKTAYLMNNGADIKQSAEDAYTNIYAVYEDLSNPGYQTTLVAYGYANQEILNNVCNSLGMWLETVKSVIDDPWAILDNAYVLAEGLTDAQYASLDELIAADATLADRTFNGAVPETLTVNTSTVEAEVNRYTVTVQVSAQVIDKTDVNTAELTALLTETTVIKMTAGSTGAAVLSQIVASGIEESALADWDSFYGVNEDNYIRSVSVDLTEDYTLEGNITYTITYTPRTLTVTYGEGYAEGEKTPAEVPYGYQMKLPAYNGDLVYDYTVNGSEADQGDVVRVTGNTTLSRVTGKAWNYYGIGKLVSGNYAVGDTVAQNILTSTALRTGTFRLRTPGNADGLLSMDSSTGVYTVTAKAFKADTGDLWWIPETGTLKGGEADGTAISFTLADGINYTAEFDAGLSFDRIAVNYKVVLPWSVVGVTAEEALEILNLPHVLTTEAKSQLSSMETLNGEYANFEALNDNINALWVAVNGSDLPQESKNAMKDLLDNCLDGDGTLYLYSYLNEYRACETNGEKLAVYYLRYDGATGLKAQIDKFCESFDIIAIDNRDSFVAFLNQMNYGQYVEKIDRIYSALTDIQTNLIAPNGAVDTADDGLNALTELVADAIDQTKAYGTVLEEPVMNAEVSMEKEPEAPEYTLGDIDGDGKINAKDSNLIKKIITGKLTVVPAADINGDGKVTVVDLYMLRRIIVSK